LGAINTEFSSSVTILKVIIFQNANVQSFFIAEFSLCDAIKCFETFKTASGKLSLHNYFACCINQLSCVPLFGSGDGLKVSAFFKMK
jgi:hypothetical protein